MELADTKLQPFEPERYRDVSLNDLVMYAVYVLAEMNNEINTEEIVAACFLLFPQRFHLRGYPHWPDSTVVNKRWLDCRDRGYITGSTAHGFSITPKGLEVAERTASVLSGKRRHFSRRVPSKLTAEARTRAGRFIRLIVTNWTHFEDLLQRQQWVQHIFDTMERSRNVIMHSGHLPDEDIERLGISIRDWMKQTGG